MVLSRQNTPVMRRPSVIMDRARWPAVEAAEVVVDEDEEAAVGVVAAAAATALGSPASRAATPPVASSNVSVTNDGVSEAAEGEKEARLRQGLPDRLDFWMLREELRKASAALARATASPEVVGNLDLPGLASLRAELVAAHSLALERIDDRRVTLQAQQAASQEGPERGRCIACWVRKADRVLLPCRHLCLCGSCLESCNASCPICRGVVADSMEIFGVT